jgi:hypothetical protein
VQVHEYCHPIADCGTAQALLQTKAPFYPALFVDPARSGEPAMTGPMERRRRFVIVLPAMALLLGCAIVQTPRERLEDAYTRSIPEAAVKTPNSVRTLTPIDMTKPEIVVAHLQSGSTIDPARYIWISLPDELRTFCKDKQNRVLALEMALGLPPDPTYDKLFTFKISPADLFRPCASSPLTTTTSCSVDVPRDPSADSKSEHFVLKQMMDSYRIGFPSVGYPFTAMGWSYDWDPDSATHQGVSEYVTKPGAAIADVASTTPDAFCEAQP